MADELGTRIRKARKEAGLKREQMAVALNVSVATVDRLEQGRAQVTVDRLARIATLTGKPLSFFLGKQAAA